MLPACNHQPRAGAADAGLSRFAAARIAALRAERKSLNELRAAKGRTRQAHRMPALDLAPFGHDTAPLIAAIARRNAADAAAVVGLLCFVLAILVASALFGDAPGMPTALAAAGG